MRLIIIAAVLVLAACSSTVSGHPEGIPGARHALDCPSGAITVHGAPFCYPRPAGFTNYSSLSTYGAGWTYRTLVSIGTNDLIEVLAYKLPTDADRLSAAGLRALYRSQQLVVGKLNITQADPPSTTNVDGARAFDQHATFANGVTTDTTTIYRGRTLVSVQCQSRTQVSAVATACADVVARLQVVAL